MISACILMQTQVGRVPDVERRGGADRRGDLGRAGHRPLRRDRPRQARDLDELGKLVVNRIREVEGIARTLTCPVAHL